MNVRDVMKSFQIRDTLNTNVWEEDKTLNPKVRKILLKVAKKFIDDWNVDKKIKIHDIRFTGSLAAYNWSKFSDIDLHIIVQYKDLNKDINLVSRFFTLMKSHWNNKHNIKIDGYEIEVYVEDMSEKHTATGLYSVTKDEWIKEPKPTDAVYDEDDVLTKSKYFFNLYNDILVPKYREGKYVEVIRTIEKTKEKIRKMRSSGLARGGEFSTENLVFKVLRRTDLMGKMNDLITKSTDKILSEKTIM
jgi:hypothetical protein